MALQLEHITILLVEKQISLEIFGSLFSVAYFIFLVI